ncbi:uncharacterized protein LOC5508016 [Nematostella vectensis]|uniref:uncharacterized protein LOC5508016 n=1 Tax=Nematostella vectensis TaxID=45351 RepID=UPI00207744B9|nr:uncharacterized protein LOC5508016 [Nematostella vectensis]
MLQFLVITRVISIFLFTKVEGAPKPVAFYPLNAVHKTRDISGNNLPVGIASSVTLVKGLDGREGGAYYFSGTSSSYIEIPYHAMIDTRYSLTVLAWARPEKDGPILNYYRSNFGVHFWITNNSPSNLFIRIMTRSHVLTKILVSEALSIFTWYFVGFSYDYTSGCLKLYLNGVLVREYNIGKVELATDREIRLGAVTHDSRYYRGRITCLQIYNTALSRNEIRDASAACDEIFWPCFDFVPIDELTKAANHIWYRLGGETPRRITTRSPRSSLGLSGWMNGTHPQRETGPVTRDLCFAIGNGSCEHEALVTVRQCYGYFVYKFLGLPSGKLRISTEQGKDLDTPLDVLFRQRPGHHLTGHVFYQESPVPSPTRCVGYCLVSGERCKSVNYNSAQDNGICQLNNATASKYDQHISANQEWGYYEPITVTFV